MLIRDIHIEQELYDTRTGNMFTVYEILAHGKIRDTDRFLHDITDVKPIKGEPYIESDPGLNPSLHLDTIAGKLVASISDTHSKEGFKGISLQFVKGDMEELVNLAEVRVESETTTIFAYDDPKKQYPNQSHMFTINNEDIRRYLESESEDE